MYNQFTKKFDKYQFQWKNILGKGGFGQVFRGQNVHNQQLVAIKMIDRKKISKDTYFINALYQQIKNLQSLQSTNIVKILDAIETQNNFYIVQQLCNSDLREKINKQKVLSQKQAIANLKQICRGCADMIKKGIIHRDLKPQNILIDFQGNLKICDFGLSKKLQNLDNINTTTFGTPQYKSLQILSSQEYTNKCDIWALGVIFYEMLHGRPPWKVSNNRCNQYLLAQLIKSQPLIISQQLSQKTIMFLKSTLQKQQKDRIDWNKLLRHPIFEGQFLSKQQKQKSEQQLNKVMQSIKSSLINSQFTIQNILIENNCNENSKFFFQDVQALLINLGVQLSDIQQQLLFTKFDKDCKGYLSTSEMKKVFSTSKVKKNFKIINDDNKMVLNKTQQIKSPIIYKLQQALRKFNSTTIQGNIFILPSIFHWLSKSRNDKLTKQDLHDFLIYYDSSFTGEEINIAFQIIDFDKSQIISYNQFKNYFCIAVGIQNDSQE